MNTRTKHGPGNSQKFELRILLLALSMCGLAGGAAQAADSDYAPAPAVSGGQNDTAQIGEIIVTAQKRAQDIGDVPVSITAATGYQLAKEGIAEPADLTKLDPSFTYQVSDYGTPVFTIRGVGFNDFSLGAGPTVTTYIDQVPLPYSVMTRGAILDLDRVEVLKGPQGTLFGENSTGGAVNFVAAKPSAALTDGVDLTYGRFNDTTLQGFISGPIASTLSARIALRLEHSDGWQQSTTRPGDTLGAKDFTDARLLLDWKPSDAVRFELNLSGWQDRSETQAGQFQAFTPSAPPAPINAPVYAALENYPVAANNARAADWDAGTDYHRDDKFYLTSLRGDWDFSQGYSLSSITAYSRYMANTPLDADGTDFPNLDIHKDGDLNSFFQELRVAYSASQVRWMIGGNYQKDKQDETDSDVFQATNVSVGPYSFPGGRFIDDENVRTASAFGNLEYQVTESVVAQASVRYSHQDRDFDGCFADLGDGVAARAFDLLSTMLSGTPTNAAPGSCLTLSSVTFKPLPVVTSSLDQHNVPWRGSLSWKPDADTLLYASVTKGFKAGSYSVPAAALDTQLASVTQESVLAYETGFKASMADRKVQLSGATFYYDYLNKQLDGHVLNPIFGPLQQLINIPKSRVVGAELEEALYPVTGLRISGGVTYLDSKVQANPVAPAQARDPLGNLVNYVGESFPNTPKWLGVTDAEYSFPLQTEVRGFVGGTFTYRSRSNAAFGEVPLFELESYGVLDLRAGLESPNGTWRVQFYGHNVTDKYYWTGVSRNIDTVDRIAGMPVTYGIALSYRH